MDRSSWAILLITVLGGRCAFSTELLVTEVLPIGYRTLDEILSIVRPLVPAPGVVSGIDNRLVIKTTPENLQSVKALLADLDRAPRNLLISVRYADRDEARDDAAEASITLRSGAVRLATDQAPAHSTAAEQDSAQSGRLPQQSGLRVWQTQSRSDARQLQQVRVVEGYPAYIASGALVPFGEQTMLLFSGKVLGLQGTRRYFDASTGFYVVPRRRGDRVLLEFAPSSTRLSPKGGAIVDTQAMQTTVSVPLGEWVEIGGIAVQREQGLSGILQATRFAERAANRLFIRVDELTH